jgi:hypothetical protein
MSLGEALFVEDDAAERDMKDAASRSCKRVWAALAKMGIVVTTIARLGEEARRQMIEDAEAQAQVSFQPPAPTMLVSLLP